MSSVTIVICTYTDDRWATIQRAIEVLLKQSSFSDELLVVVDHNESLLAKCRDTFADCLVIPNRHSRGLSGARNTALERARGSIVIFLDDDAVPLDGWLDALRAPYVDERINGVGGFAKPHWARGRPRWFPDEFLWVVGCSHRGLPSVAQPVRNLIGANMSFRKVAFDSVGGFVEAMGRVGTRPLGCEETEFSIRLTKANPDVVLLYNPAAQVEHYVSGQRGSIRYFAQRCWAEGLSKAEVSRRVGRSRALSSERHYASQVLPRGVWQGLRESSAGDIWGVARAAAIVLGFTITTAGYCVGNLRRPAYGNSKAC
jgi:glycosyltransferase involved in cell wall biosynthesis